MRSLATACPFPQILLSRVEEAGLNASAPPQQRLVDGWLVRFSPGKAKRARCINAICAGHLTVVEKLSLCEGVYAACGLPMLVRITPFSQPQGLDAALAALGLSEIDDTRVMVLADVSAPSPARLLNGFTFQMVGNEAFAQAVGALRESPLALRQAHAERLANAPVPFTALLLKHEGRVVACGQFAVEGDLAGLYDIFTAPDMRGQGMARLICGELLRRATASGARHAYLQVDASNAPARSVYRRLGFADGYAYHYRVRPG
jgi:ribosomal protein S18 acetylase RimI-like enzyme